MYKLVMQSSVNNYLALDPRTKILMTLVISTIMISGSDQGIMHLVKLILASIPFILVIGAGKWDTATMYFILYGLAYLGQYYLIPSTQGILNFSIVAVCAVFFRFMPGIMMGTYLVNTTRVSEFTLAMEKMKVSQKIIIPACVMFRFFPTLGEEYRAISDAMRMRGIRFGGGKLSKMLEYRLVPLMISCVKIGEELSVAAVSRGLGAPIKRTSINEIGFKIQDKIGITVMCIIVVLFILAKSQIM